MRKASATGGFVKVAAGRKSGKAAGGPFLLPLRNAYQALADVAGVDTVHSAAESGHVQSEESVLGVGVAADAAYSESGRCEEPSHEPLDAHLNGSFNGAQHQDQGPTSAVDEVNGDGIAEGACEEVSDKTFDVQTTAAFAEAGGGAAHEHESATKQSDDFVLRVRAAAGAANGESGRCEEPSHEMLDMHRNGSVNEVAPHQGIDTANAFDVVSGDGGNAEEGACKERRDATFDAQTTEALAEAGDGVAHELESATGEHGNDAEGDDRSSSEAARKLTVATWWRQQRDAERAAAAARRRRKRQRRKRSREKAHTSDDISKVSADALNGFEAANDHDIAVFAEHGDVDDEDVCGELFEENCLGVLDAESATASDSEAQQAAADLEALQAVQKVARSAWNTQPIEVTKTLTEHEFVYFYTLATEGLLEHTRKFIPEFTAEIDAFKRAMLGVT